MRVSCLLSFSLLIFSITATAQDQTPRTEASRQHEFQYRIIPGANHTYGYDIFLNGKLKIHQPSVPGLPGTDGFKRKEDAEKVARLVLVKVRKGEMPPTITLTEMKNNGVMIPDARQSQRQ